MVHDVNKLRVYILPIIIKNVFISMLMAGLLL